MKICYLLAAFALAGCGSSDGFLRDSNTAHNFEYKMDVSEIDYVRSISGSVSNDSILCLIPTNLGEDPNFYSSAMKNLYSAANLQPNQVLANIREDTKTIWYIFGCTRSLTVSADIISLTPNRK